jgi:hypothetical protein
MGEQPRRAATPGANRSTDPSDRPDPAAETGVRPESGITNRPVNREREEQEHLPARSQRKDGDSHA